ncbi:MAG: DUF3106 domain-containing protein [Verrucomicrobiia bacterium]|jgi:hypothetical protein
MSSRILILALALGGLVCLAPSRTCAEPVLTNAPGGDIQLPKNLPPRLREKMAKMSPAERQKMLERWQQLRNLSPEVRKLLNKNYQKFSKMPPEQREQLKQRLQQWQSMSPEEKEKLQENFRRWKQLSPQEREDLRKRHARHPPASGNAPSSGPFAPAVKALPAAAQAAP